MGDRREVLLAVELVRLGADVVVVGSTARLLRRGYGDPRDLDVVVEDADVTGLVAALRSLGASATAAVLRRCRDVRIDTAWGPLDVFVAPRPTTGTVRVHVVDVAVDVAVAVGSAR
jgi:hypothetical protein